MVSTNNGRSIAVAIYTHPELYPPVLNAIDELTEVFNSVHVISRNLMSSHWRYPNSVQIFASGKRTSIKDSERRPLWWKLKSFVIFTKDFYRILKLNRRQWVMCNDSISLLSFRLIRSFLGYPVRLWYHSHDVVELPSLRKFSVGYFAAKSEMKYFHRINLFTLPSEARLKFFAMSLFRGSWMIVPNYPSLRRNSLGGIARWKTGADLKLLYQGRVSSEHGLEEVIDFVQTDASLRLTIIGPGDETFVRFLKNKTVELGITDRVSVLDPVPYRDLYEITLSHQVGVAINKPVNVLYSTAAMASNKIYEYAASGLPVLYYKDEHYVQFLSEYIWGFPTSLSTSDLAVCIRNIRLNFNELSQAAQTDFRTKLNFGVAFSRVISLLT